MISTNDALSTYQILISMFGVTVTQKTPIIVVHFSMCNQIVYLGTMVMMCQVL